VRTVIYGSRPDGHAKVVAELLAPAAGLDLVGLIDDFPDNVDHRIGELGVIGTSADLPQIAARTAVRAAILGFGAGRGRSAIAAALIDAGLTLPVLVHPRALVAPSARLGPGCQVLPGAVVGPGAELGTGVLVNTGAIVEHDARLSDGVVIYSGAVLAGRVSVGVDVELGAGATVLPDVRIGARAAVGAGATVTADVADGQTVVGNPARPIRRAG
jgi:UDP-perosamine 4-acetyltransferase